jgi:hypothetical protein
LFDGKNTGSKLKVLGYLIHDHAPERVNSNL